MKTAVFHNLPSGGAKRTVHEQVKRLAQNHRVDVFSLGTADHEFADIRPFGGRHVVASFAPGRLYRSPWGRLNQAVRSADLLRLRRVMRGLAEQIDQASYDVVLVHPCMFTFSPTILRALRTPALYYRHDPVRWLQDPSPARPYDRQNTLQRRIDAADPARAFYFRLLEYEDRTSTLAATRVVTNSYFMRETLFRLYGIAPEVAYHGVDIERFRPLQLAREDFVLSVGAISPYKGYDFIVRGLARIPAAECPRLVLVGNTTLAYEQRYLAQLAEELGVRVEFLHLIDDERLVQLYNQALCTVYTPIMEPFGLVPLESMACGTPVVGIREGGVRETVIHGETGLLVDRNQEQLAEAVQALRQERSLVDRLGAQARAQVEANWTWEQAVARLEGYLIATARRGARTD